LFRGSVFDNIANGLCGTALEKASREEKMSHVVAAAKTAYAHDFILQLPNGYDTEIGQRGGLISGGQKQRIAIARSLVSNPRVLLLDEATSALDPHAEGIVQQALDQASAGRTTIVIAHKLATVRNAHNIIVMSKGEIVEQGTHNELIDLKGAYSRLVTIQQLTVSGEDSPEGTEVELVDEKSFKDDSEEKEELARRTTTNQASVHIQAGAGKYNDEDMNQLGLLATIWRLISETPDLKWAYLAVLSGCVVSGRHPSPSPHPAIYLLTIL
jgi:ATP-binding cassette subfamily B (MDR/TAP) protein 1